MKHSVNTCCNCGKKLTLTEEKFYKKECTECNYLAIIGARSIENYNKWLKGEL